MLEYPLKCRMKRFLIITILAGIILVQLHIICCKHVIHKQKQFNPLPVSTAIKSIIYSSLKDEGHISKSAYDRFRVLLNGSQDIKRPSEIGSYYCSLILISDKEGKHIKFYKINDNIGYLTIETLRALNENYFKEEINKSIAYYKVPFQNDIESFFKDRNFRFINLGQEPINPFPDIKIENIYYEIWIRDLKKRISGYVPKRFFLKLGEMFDNSLEDSMPLRWQILGRLEITLQTDEKFKINLYYTDKDLGAFSIDQANIRRKYYRNGSDKEFVDFFIGIENQKNNVRFRSR